ncbi:Inhibitor of DNA binding 3 [Dermatophagoides farinae]|uniref:Inhibitor of DNA binding 3 n=1 Tax=Dermatophagoides farinae TaxID=6954 RepID=A0A922IC66_DERFA|nr:hypothetical protein HUG17_4719 [Dermatophagoides farinae]KAH9527616.1 Inhibitor of DNA binding 3 [Dermatophagoides farinae]
MAPASVNQTNEISRMLNKLRTLVPGISPEQKMSKLEIMQHVIDYINDLETVLDQQSNGPDGQEDANKAKGTLHQLRQLVN